MYFLSTAGGYEPVSLTFLQIIQFVMFIYHNRFS